MTTTPQYQPIEEISVKELALRLADRDQIQLIDVRELAEIAIVQLEGFTVLPLSQYEQWSESINDRLDPHKETLVICHHGVRSAQMCQWLQMQGFINVKNIVGGIHAYSQHIDPSLPQY